MRVFDGIQQIHYLWTFPMEALTILALLSSLTGIYSLPHLSLFVFFPIHNAGV